MKLFILSLTVACMCCACMLGCTKRAHLDTKWSAPVKFSQTEDGLAVSFFVHKWNNAVLVLRYESDHGAEYNCWVLGRDGMTWQNTKFSGFAGFYGMPVMIDPTTNQLVFLSTSNSEEEVKFTLRLVSLDESLHINGVTDHEFNVTPPLASEQFVAGAVSAGSATRQAEYFVPYNIRIHVRHGNVEELGGASPSSIGLFHSPDRGHSWRQDSVLCRPAWVATLGVLEHGFYFLGWRQWGLGGDIWFSKQDSDHPSTASEVLTKTCADGFSRADGDDTIHLCWMDSRHEEVPLQLSMLLSGALPRKNYEVFYRHVTGSDNAWGRETLVSKGLLFSYRPTISVEGKKVVIAWAGTRKSVGKYHSDYSPNDIYYATSADNGQTWSMPVRVTDDVSRGFTAGDPQVVLLRDVIHLFYIEGKYQKGPSTHGMTLLKQPPWDIIYQRRAFPSN